MNSKDLQKFVVVWAVDSLLFYFVNTFFPQGYELGTATVSVTLAVVLSGFLLALFGRLAKNFSKNSDFRKKGRPAMFLYYLAVNSLGVWLIARLAAFTGFGIARYHWAIVLGLLATLAQWLVRQVFKSLKLV